MTQIRVLLADDHAIVRGGLEQLLSTADDIDLVGTAADGVQIIGTARVVAGVAATP